MFGDDAQRSAPYSGLDELNRRRTTHVAGAAYAASAQQCCSDNGRWQRHCLRPYTQHCPKPMIPVGDQPMLEILLEQCISQRF